MTENEKILKANGYRRAYIEYPIYRRDAGGRSVFIRIFGRRARLSIGMENCYMRMFPTVRQAVLAGYTVEKMK